MILDFPGVLFTNCLLDEGISTTFLPTRLKNSGSNPTTEHLFSSNDIPKKCRKLQFHEFFMAFRWPVLIILDPDLSRDILVKDFDHFVDRTPAEVMKSFEKSSSKWDQLWSIQKTFFNCGEKWKTLRSTFSPMFTSGNSSTPSRCSQSIVDLRKNEKHDGVASKLLQDNVQLH